MRKPFFVGWDLLLYALLLALGIGGTAALHASNSDSAMLKVQVGKAAFYYPMSYRGELVFWGRLGKTVIRVDETGARVVESACPGGDCMRGAAIHQAGQWRACLPNEVILSVEGRQAGKSRKKGTPVAEGWVDEAVF